MQTEQRKPRRAPVCLEDELVRDLVLVIRGAELHRHRRLQARSQLELVLQVDDGEVAPERGNDTDRPRPLRDILQRTAQIRSA